jgi:hypothetical protein
MPPLCENVPAGVVQFDVGKPATDLVKGDAGMVPFPNPSRMTGAPTAWTGPLHISAVPIVKAMASGTPPSRNRLAREPRRAPLVFKTVAMEGTSGSARGQISTAIVPRPHPLAAQDVRTAQW